jgi:hypothetical protein
VAGVAWTYTNQAFAIWIAESLIPFPFKYVQLRHHIQMFRLDRVLVSIHFDFIVQILLLCFFTHKI